MNKSSYDFVIYPDTTPKSEAEAYFDRLFSIAPSYGWPDRMFFTDGKLIGVEIKRNGQPLNYAQMTRAEEIHRKGYTYIVLRQFERKTAIAAPRFIFIFLKYVGDGCFQGMTLDQFTNLTKTERLNNVSEVDLSIFSSNVRYEGFLLSAQVGPIYTVEEVEG